MGAFYYKKVITQANIKKLLVRTLWTESYFWNKIMIQLLCKSSSTIQYYW